MKPGSKSRHCRRVGMTAGQVVLLITVSGFLCVASSSPRLRESYGDQSAVRAEIPFQLYKGNAIVVKATIGKMKNVNMILDTGSSPSAISQKLADRLKLRGQTESLRTLSGTIQAQSLILPGIQIGSWAASPIRVMVNDLNFMERSLGISLGGVAGLDILSRRSFAIDFGRRKIVFGPITASEKSLRFEPRVPFLMVRAIIEGHPVRLLVDSGASGLLVYRNCLPTTQQVRLDPNVSIFSPGGGLTHIRSFRAGVLLGTVNLGARNVAIADIDSDTQNDIDGLFGFADMEFRKVSFDFENGMLGWD